MSQDIWSPCTTVLSHVNNNKNNYLEQTQRRSCGGKCISKIWIKERLFYRLNPKSHEYSTTVKTTFHKFTIRGSNPFYFQIKAMKLSYFIVPLFLMNCVMFGHGFLQNSGKLLQSSEEDLQWNTKTWPPLPFLHFNQIYETKLFHYAIFFRLIVWCFNLDSSLIWIKTEYQWEPTMKDESSPCSVL